VRTPALGARALLVLLGIAVAIAAFGVWRGFPVSVTPTRVERRDVARTLVLTGRVRPPARPRIGSSVAGIVREVYVREGDRVRRGQVLIRLDDAQQVAAVAEARAVLVQAAARSRSAVDQAQAAFEQANRDLERARRLFAQGAISARDVEVAERTASDAASRLAEARATVGQSVPTAEVAQARAAVAAAQARLSLTRITAPMPATVLMRAVEPGDAVTPGQALLELAVDGPTELVAHAREENLPDLRVGGAAVASADAFPNDTFAARIAWLAPAVDPAQGTVEVRFTVPEPPSYLRADITVSVNVEVERREHALVVPFELVRDLDTAPWVVVARDGRAERIPLRLGIRGDRAVEILEGVSEGEAVLPPEVDPGRRVRIAPER
jgi:HlyD family secretion protein